MRGIHLCVLVAAIALGLAPPAFAQFAGPPTLPSDQFRAHPSPPIAVDPARPPTHAGRRPAAAPTSALRRPAVAPPRTGPRGLAAVSASPQPTYDEGTVERIGAALKTYTAIEARGGWPTLAPDAIKLAPGASGPEVARLRQRLALTDDLRVDAAASDAYDEATIAAVKRFQARHGFAETGTVGPQTLAALNVPAAQRVRQLAASLERLSATSFTFGHRYVVVNIPAAVAEAVANDRVEHRYVAVVGKPDRPSPTVTSLVTTVNLNPTWTVPLSIAKKDVVPKMAKDPTYLARMHMRLLDGLGNEINPALVDWKADRVPAYTIRQDPGAWNSLGFLRIDMPNPHSVYMHDTPHRELFGSDYRFHSSGCARIGDVRALATWLLQDNPGWGRHEIDAGIATGNRTDIRLAHAVPVAWIYLTGWATADGNVHFRNDIYKHDLVPEKPFMVSLQRPAAVSVATRGFMLQSAESRPAEMRQVSYLDNR